MKSTRTASLWMTVFTLIPLHTLVAQVNPPAHSPHACGQCQLPANRCQCQHHVAPTQIEYVPQTQTRYRQQQEITYKEVKETRYRMEAKTEKVPVTTYETVTVDEGGYQKVWVPKLVTKQVPKTCYQNRITYNRVPYEVTLKVPQVATKCVPEQVVTWVPRSNATTAQTNCETPSAQPKEETAELESIPSRRVRTAMREEEPTPAETEAEAEPRDELAPSPNLLDTPGELLGDGDEVQEMKGNPFEQQTFTQESPVALPRTPKQTVSRAKGKFVRVPKAVWYAHGTARR